MDSQTAHEPTECKTIDRSVSISPRPINYICIGGLLGALSGGPLITNPWNPLANPNPIGYLLLLLGFPLGAIVYRVRVRKYHALKPKAKQFIKVVLLIPIVASITTAFLLWGNLKTIALLAIVLAPILSFGAAMIIANYQKASSE